MTNVVLVAGTLARPAAERELPSGDRLMSLELTTRQTDGTAETVPVSWAGPPAWASTLDTGAELVVLGRVRRRFFRAGGVTQSRTEVVASRVVKAGSKARVEAVRAEAAALIDNGRIAAQSS